MLSDIVKKRMLPDVCVVKFDTIKHCLLRRRSLVYQLGCPSTFQSVEDIAVTIIIQMIRIRHSLTPSKGLQLINDLNSNTTVEFNLIE